MWYEEEKFELRTLGEHLHHCDSIEDNEDGDEKSTKKKTNLVFNLHAA